MQRINESHDAPISSSIRALFAYGDIHSHASDTPQMHAENSMGTPVALSAFAIATYRVCGSTFWLLQLSYFRYCTPHSAYVAASITSWPIPPGRPPHVAVPASLYRPNRKPNDFTYAMKGRRSLPGNLLPSGTMPPLELRELCQQSSRLNCAYPAARYPSDTTSAAISRKSVSL